MRKTLLTTIAEPLHRANAHPFAEQVVIGAIVILLVFLFARRNPPREIPAAPKGTDDAKP